MAVAFRSDNEVTNGTAGTSVTMSKPSGIVDTGSNPDRDHLFAVIVSVGVPSITPPADWNLVDTVASGSALTMWVYEKLASSEGASWTWTLGASQRNLGWVGAYTGVDPTSPTYNAVDTATLTASLSLYDGGNVTPGARYLLAAAATRTASGAATTWTVVDDDAATISERADLSTNAGSSTDVSGVVADRLFQAFAVNALAATATASQTQTAGVAEFIVLRPYFVPYGGNANDAGIVVEAAYDVDPYSDSSEWTFTTLSLLESAQLSMRHGVSNRATVADPSSLSCTVKNLTGQFTHPTGIYYNKLQLNTPIRVRLNGFGVDVGGVGYHRGTFFLTSAAPRWDASTNFAVIDLQAQGRLGWLQSDEEEIQSPAYTAVQRMASNSGLATPVAHWPFEDESDATRVASAVSGVDPATTGSVTFGAASSFVGSRSLATVTSSSQITALVPTYTGTNTWTVMFASMVPSEPTVEFGLLGWYGTGTAAIWQVTVAPGSPSVLHLRAYNSAGTSILDATASLTEAEFYALPQYIRVTCTQSGTGISYSLSYAGVGTGGGATGTLASNTVGVVQRFNFSPQTGTVSGTVIGHVALHVQPGAEGADVPNAILLGNSGEWPWSRFARLADEQNIPYTLESSTNTDLEMGAETVVGWLERMRESETVEGSVLNDSGFDHDSTGLVWFPARDDRENIDASLTLDMASGHVQPGFTPILDNQNVVNDVTVSRSTGSSGRVTDEASIARIGRKKQPVTVNTEDDRFLTDLAGIRVAEGTVGGYRFPQVRWNLRRSPELAEAWVTTKLFQRLDIQNPPSQYPPDDIRNLLMGYSETLSSDTWTVDGNLSSFEPYSVMEMASTSGDTSEWLGVLDGDEKCALRTAITTSGTSLLVDPNRFRWTTAADDFPRQIRLGGEVVTLSGIATTAATYVAAGTPAHADNAAVSPSIFAGATTGDSIFVLAAIRSSGTGTLTTPTGYTRLPVWLSTDNMQLYVKVHSGSESAPTITPSGGSSGDTVSAVTFGFRGTPVSLADPSDMVFMSLAQLNGSAANIAWPGLYPRQLEGCVILGLGWKQDDYTSVAPGVWTEAVEASSTTGNDQSLYVAYQIQTTPTVINEGSWVVTGGASAISRSAVVAIAAGYQTFTASARSVNGVTKAHSAGTVIEAEDPGRLGM